MKMDVPLISFALSWVQRRVREVPEGEDEICKQSLVLWRGTMTRTIRPPRSQYALSSSLQVDLQVLPGEGPESVRVPKRKLEL